MAQGLVLVLLGGMALFVTVANDLYLNYVQSYFRWVLVAAGLVLVVLGAMVVVAELRHARRERRAARGADWGAAAEDGHEGGEEAGCGPGHVPRAAWLLLVPVVTVFVVTPPALGSYSATSGTDSGAAAAEAGSANAGPTGLPASPDEPYELKVQEFVLYAWTDEERALDGQRVRLTGFAAPAEGDDEGEGWYLARLEIACCAADAIVNRVLVTNQPEPEPDSWFTVEGYWEAPEGDLAEAATHRFEADTMTEVANPPNPYE